MFLKTTKTAVIMGVLMLYGICIAKPSDISVGGLLVILGQKMVNPEKETGKNIDFLLGLADVYVKAKADKFQGVTELYFFPAGFGFEYVQSTVLDTTNDIIVSKVANETRVSVVNAYARYSTKYVDILTGRAKLNYSSGFFFGDYLHRGAGFIVDYLGTIHNCTQFLNTAGVFTTNVLLGVSDPNLNKGYLLFRESVTPTPTSELAFGYQGNVFDKFRYEDADIISNLSISARLDYTKGQSIFTEFGMRGMGAPKDDQKRFPFMFGFTVPTADILTRLAIEAEYESKRETVEKLCPFSYGISTIKAFTDHFWLVTSVNNGYAKDASKVLLYLAMKMFF